MKLSGYIPPEIGKFSELEYFNLAGKKLSGFIPDELLNCTSLVFLNLSGNIIQEGCILYKHLIILVAIISGSIEGSF